MPTNKDDASAKIVHWSFRILAAMLLFVLISLLVVGFRLVLTPLAVSTAIREMTPEPEGKMVLKTPSPDVTASPVSTPTPEPNDQQLMLDALDKFLGGGTPAPKDRRETLKGVSTIFGGIPIASTVLGALTEFAPILLALYFIRDIAKSKKPGFEQLFVFSGFLVLVHFFIYFIPATSRVFLGDWQDFVGHEIVDRLKWVLETRQIPYALGFVEGARRLGVAMLGVILPVVIWQWTAVFRKIKYQEPLPKKAQSRAKKETNKQEEPVNSKGLDARLVNKWVDTAFHVLVILLCVALPIYKTFSSGITVPKENTGLTDFITAWPASFSQLFASDMLVLKQGLTVAQPVWFWAALLAGGIFSLAIRWLFQLGAKLLKWEIPSVWLWISTLIILGINVCELPTLWNDPFNSSTQVQMYLGRLWFPLMILLGLALELSLARASYYGLRMVMGWKAELSHQGRWLGVFILLVFSIPTLGLVDNGEPLGRLSDIYQLAYRLDDLLIFMWIAAVMYILYLDGKAKGDLNISVSSQKLASLAAGVFLFGLARQFLYVPVTYLVGYFLLLQITNSHALTQPKFKKNQLRGWIRTFSLLRVSEQMYGKFRREKTKKLAESDGTLSKFVEEMDAYDNKKKELEKGIPVREDKLRINPLSFGPQSSAWKNGMHGLRWSLIFASPWILIYTFSFLGGDEFNKVFPLLSFVKDIIILIGLWAAIGFMMGYFFPYLPGASGLQKGLVLGVVLIGARLPLSLAYYRGLGEWQALLVLSMQIFIQCMLLGLFAFDFYALNKLHFSFQQLLEIHGLSGLGIWTSSLVAAIAAALTPLLTTQVTGEGAGSLIVAVFKLIIGSITGLDMSSLDFMP